MATSTVPARKTRTGTSSILLKVIMAVSGLFFVFYLLLHMYGNLQILRGREAFDGYAHHLRVLGEGMIPENGALWVFRILLLVALVAHVYSAVTLWHRAGAARSSRYVGKRKGGAYGPFYAKAMRWGGIGLLLFVIFHILHFTTQTITFGGAHESPAQRVIESFGQPIPVLIYVVAMVAVGLHLMHGIWGACMTLGLNTSLKRAEQIRFIGIAVSTIIVVGFLIPPFAILFGLVN